MARLKLLLMLVLLAAASRVAAQPATCPSLVTQALIDVGDRCGTLARNEACYGNLSMLATPRSAGAELSFDEPGDRVPVVDVQSLTLSPLTPEVPEWGIALMALQANLPDSLPGQNATIVLFGDVEIENRGEDSAPPQVFVTGNNVNVRQAPSTSGAVVGRLGGTPQPVVGRLADSSWLRVALDDGTDGWVSASVVTVNGAVGSLPETTVDAPAPIATRYGPMQAFRLRSGIGQPACSEAPVDGIVIQTPSGAGRVRFEVNRVTISLASTAIVRGAPGADMRITLLEGGATVAIPGSAAVTLVPFQTAVVALDAAGEPAGPIRVEESLASDYAVLPIALLPTPVDVPRIDADHPIAVGIWHAINDIEPDGVSCTAADGSGTPLAFVDGEGEEAVTINSPDEIVFAGVTMTRSGENMFGGPTDPALDYFGYTSQDTFTTVTFLSPTRATTVRTVTFNAPNGQSCAWVINSTLHYLRSLPEE